MEFSMEKNIVFEFYFVKCMTISDVNSNSKTIREGEAITYQ